MHRESWRIAWPVTESDMLNTSRLTRHKNVSMHATWLKAEIFARSKEMIEVSRGKHRERKETREKETKIEICRIKMW